MYLTLHWLKAPCPQIKTPTIAQHVARTQRAALMDVSRDIELHGSVTYATVEVVRAALALERS